MSTITVEANNQTSRRLRISLRGVQILSVAPSSSGTASRNLPQGLHVMQWAAAGIQGEKYTIKATGGLPPCTVDGATIPADGIDAGECRFRTF